MTLNIKTSNNLTTRTPKMSLCSVFSGNPILWWSTVYIFVQRLQICSVSRMKAQRAALADRVPLCLILWHSVIFPLCSERLSSSFHKHCDTWHFSCAFQRIISWGVTWSGRKIEWWSSRWTVSSTVNVLIVLWKTPKRLKFNYSFKNSSKLCCLSVSSLVGRLQEDILTFPVCVCVRERCFLAGVPLKVLMFCTWFSLESHIYDFASD